MLIRPGLQRGARKRGFFAGGTTFNFALTTLAALLSAGLTNAVATTNPPGTVVGPSGVVQYGAHNLLRNSTMQGASAGVAPTDWNAATNGNGLTATVLGTGAALGQTYVDIRYSGTTTSTSKGQIIMQSPSASYAPAANGQTWTLSGYVAVVGGSTANCTVELGIDEMSAVPSVLTSGYSAITPTASLTQFSFTRTNVNASTASLRTHVNINASGVGVAIDITLRILMPQLQRGPAVLDFVPTTTAPVYAPRLTCDRGATHNLIQHSEDLSQAIWGLQSGVTIAQDTSAPLPTGVSAAWKVTAGASIGGWAQQLFVSAAGQSYTVGLLARQGNRTTFDLGGTNQGVVVFVGRFDFSTGTCSSVGGSCLPAMTYVGNGWWLCTVTKLFTAGNANDIIQIYPGNNGAIVNGDYVTVTAARVQRSATPLAYLRTFAAAPLYASGTPTQQNLLQVSGDMMHNVTFSANVTAGATTVTIGATASSAYHYKRAFAGITLTPGTVYTGRVRFTGPAGRSIGVRINGSATEGKTTVLCTGSPQTVLVSVNADNVQLDLGFDNRSAICPGANAQTGDVFTVHEIAVYEGTADIGHTATTGTPVSVYPQLGLVSEEARTNGIRNNTMQGGANGSPGTVPTYWFTGGLGTLTQTLTFGTEWGQPYIDVRLNGTTSTTVYQLYMEQIGAIAASPSQAWTASAYMRLAAGSLTNIGSVALSTTEWTSGSGYVTEGESAISLAPVYQRAVHTRTTIATTASITPTVNIYFASGVAIDVTVRILLPQMEQGSFATSPIATAGAAVARSSDLVRAGALLGDAGTLRLSATAFGLASGTQWLVTRGGGSPAFHTSSGSIGIFDGTSIQYAGVSIVERVPFTIVTRWGAGTMGASLNGNVEQSSAYDGTMGVGAVVALGDDSTGFNHANVIFRSAEFTSAVATGAQSRQLSAGTLQ